MNDRSLGRREAVSLPLAALVGAGLIEVASTVAPRADAAPPESTLVPARASKLRALAAGLAAAPRMRTFRTVPMIVADRAQWDSGALDLLLRYDGEPKQVWDNTGLDSPWLNLMRNAVNTQTWCWNHPDFLAISATHGSAHLALYDDYVWQKYLAAFTGGKYKANSWIKAPPAGHADPANYEDPNGAFSPAANSIAVLQRRGVVFCGCHNEVWELTAALMKKGINPDRLPHPVLAAELTNHLIPGVVLTPGVVGTIPQFQLAGFHYAK